MRDLCLLIICASSLMLATDTTLIAAESSSRVPAESQGDPEVINTELERASSDFDVPLDLLKALASLGSKTNSAEVEGPSDVPRAFGIMGLHEDNWFGLNVTRASILLGVSSETIKYDLRMNIRAAGVLLAAFAAEGRNSSSLSTKSLHSWQGAIERFSGIHNKIAAKLFVARVFRILHMGISTGNLFIPAHTEIGSNLLSSSAIPWRPQRENNVDSGFPDAIWAGPPPSSNYQVARGASSLNFVIVHTTESSAESALDWFLNPASHVSAHYIVSSEGTIWQVVDDRDTAYHAGNFSYNEQAIGIEMEGYAGGRAGDFSWQTSEQHNRVVELIKWLTSQYGIQMDRAHLIGHNQVPGVTSPGCGGPDSWGGCSNHYDPGAWWNWTDLMMELGQAVVSSSIAIVNDCAVTALPFDSAPVITNVWNGQRFASYGFSNGNYLIYFDGHERPQPHLPAGGQFHWDAWLPAYCAMPDSTSPLRVVNSFPSWLPLFDGVEGNASVLGHSIDGKLLVPTGNWTIDADGQVWYEFFLASDEAIQTGWSLASSFTLPN